MSTKEDIFSFLNDPQAFAKTTIDDAEWLQGLEDFALPSIDANEPHPLRPAQLAAWRGLTSNRVGLVLGPPGTGKTHLLSWLITGHGASRTRANMQARTFVTAFTRNAVCNVLEAVAKRQTVHDSAAPRPIFFGNLPSQGLPEGVDEVPRGSEADLVQAINDGRVVVGATIWSLYRLLGSNVAGSPDGYTAPLFDLVCIDEASQMVLGHGLMAMAGMAQGCRVVIAGDDQQLPPIRSMRPVSVGDREVGGSLYAFLKTAEVAEFPLEETFRLNGPLARFPQQKFYPGRYQSAVPDSKVQLRSNWRDGLNQIQQLALDPDLPIVVAVHDGPPAATSNPFEASIAASIADVLAQRMTNEGGSVFGPSDFWENAVAIISPHRAHNALIRSKLPEALREHAFVETVDRIQGKERDAVILSYCVADIEFAMAEAEFIFSTERLNVAITRGRTKLIVLISRRLLEATPADQEIMDKAELLREFVFSCSPIADIRVDGPQGRQIPVQIRGQGFPDSNYIPNVEPDTEPELPRREMTRKLQGLLDAIRRVALSSSYSSATLSKVRRAMALDSEPLVEARDLHFLGWISLQKRSGDFGPYWLAKPFDAARRVYDASIQEVRNRAAMVIQEERSGRHCFYDRFRDRFAWVSETGEDVLLPVVQQLQTDGHLSLDSVNGSMTVASTTSQEIAKPEVAVEALPELSDTEFEILNKLEDIEAKRLNFGVFDAWTSTVDLARNTSRALRSVVLALSRLEKHGFVMLAEEGRVRSRIAELGRELQHVKQRFRTNDAFRRPYLTRSVKVELRDRRKPERDVPITRVMERARALASPEQKEALLGVERALTSLWGENAALAEFQVKGLVKGLAAWRGEGTSSLAIAADTGSGKTEAAVLPLLVSAFGDRLKGISGTRAILAYPRIRLATNQAQRLAAYLAAASSVPGLPSLTIGLQFGDVPNSFTKMHNAYAELWTPLSEGVFAFPLFSCPECGSGLHLNAGVGIEGADQLSCTRCDWSFGGWIGSKERLREQPPSLFLPTVDSLHQWLHDDRYGALFGDHPSFAAPRAVLADEIHLYTHIHGAQVGMTLRRLAARAAINEASSPPMLAIGMSATIKEPAEAWGRLIGRDDVEVIQPEAQDLRANPRGRETFYFVQPEVESRGVNIAGASASIQSLMCLAHGMRRRTGDEGGYRSLVFFDSIDKMRRLHSDFSDAEMNKQLASLRTSNFGDNSDGTLQSQCCGSPVGCDRFRDGECWWFAANDARQHFAGGRHPVGSPLRVADRPIYSGTSSSAEALVRGSDIVFATSSLEVGYDDPDINLVYQHYAPMNLASFIQRKGRGGRGLDDRPITGVTLSIYSPRDRWWFRRPAEMISPKDFWIPLNPDNYFVRRGQTLAALLDGLSRERAKGADFSPHSLGAIDRQTLDSASDLVEVLMGPGVWSEFNCTDVHDFWGQACASDTKTPSYFSEWRKCLDWTPELLFDAINLPALSILGDEVVGGRSEDIGLALGTVAPGNATRRYNPTTVHWIPPVDGRAPWLHPKDYMSAVAEPIPGDRESLLAQLPLDARPLLHDLHQQICRPTQITLSKLGWMAGAYWNAEAGYSSSQISKFGPLVDGAIAIDNDTRASLRGFILMNADPSRGRSIGALGQSGLMHANAFISDHDTGSQSGLKFSRVYWGADAEVRLDDRDAEPVRVNQIFTSPKTDRALLHGYQVETEGLQFEVQAKALRCAVDEIETTLSSDPSAQNWHLSRCLRYRFMSRGLGVGLPAFPLALASELLSATIGVPEFRQDVAYLSRFWSSDKFNNLLREIHCRLLSQHPAIADTRISSAAQVLDSDTYRDLFTSCFEELQKPSELRGYLESAILNGLASRLKLLVAHVGQGDERRLVAHVKNQLQFGKESSPKITVCEVGADGDGTIRGVIENWDQLQASVDEGFLVQCPNADEDAIIRRFWIAETRHSEWRSLSPNDVDALAEIARYLSDGISSVLPSVVRRLLFEVEAVGAEAFPLYDIAADVEQARTRVSERVERELNEWELVSAAYEYGRQGVARTLSRLLTAYQAEDDLGEGALSPASRISEQIHRLSVPLCHDGCRGCVQQTSDLMSDDLMEVSVSRRALQQFFTAAG